MMPIGVPRVPYRSPKEGSWQWVDIWNCLYRERIIFLSKPVDEELGNQVRAAGGRQHAMRGWCIGGAPAVCRLLLWGASLQVAAAVARTPSPPCLLPDARAQLVATMLYLDSENQKDMNLYINCSGGEVRCAWRGVARAPCSDDVKTGRPLAGRRQRWELAAAPTHVACVACLEPNYSQVVPSLAIHDTMRHIKSDVGTVGFGGCMGMSGFLLAVGKKVRLTGVLTWGAALWMGGRRRACCSMPPGRCSPPRCRPSPTHPPPAVPLGRASGTRCRTRASWCTTPAAPRAARCAPACRPTPGPLLCCRRRCCCCRLGSFVSSPTFPCPPPTWWAQTLKPQTRKPCAGLGHQPRGARAAAHPRLHGLDPQPGHGPAL